MSTPTQTYNRPNSPLDDHLAWCESEGIATSISANEFVVSVETTTRWGSTGLDIFRKSDGKKITSFDDLKTWLSILIKKG